MSTQPKPFSQYTLSNAVSPKTIVLPINEPARRDGKWANTAVRDLLQSVFPDVPVTHRKHKELVGQFAGWTGVARHYTEQGDMLKAGVLMDAPARVSTPSIGIPISYSLPNSTCPKRSLASTCTAHHSSRPAKPR
mgnify:CR=1 FL=1